mmetsp:Transcript_20979/g.37157  ORF Transcript_20979/g.37157 Transcript_20979/m.37157 type:complete len:367 (-) Transcript_20979:41-1141(-)|eukprot:CAMPEP_0184549494 /NCGR_PEP_ID=MMETSP0199_2-20130426/10820_1 /TAXON_ID=1112570 /ORGANISM="Thraustochytrium sp., Strain LLF1b" /LENGTH=366 /DNA_ID=CAMNT_0026944223 /DNA_START=114 /DNA_END=1214 /DNA_ORIENTATION=-
MKRKLSKAAAVEGRRRRNGPGAEDIDSDEEEVIEQDPSSEEDDSDDSASASEAEQGSDGDEEEGETPRKVKGAASEKDRKIMEAREAEDRRIENIVPYINKQRTLIFCSRGVTPRFRHLMEDMRVMLVNHRKEVKHDTKRNLHEINALMDMKACNNCIFFEARKRKDFYLWLSKLNGPSIKFHVLNIHTMDELRLGGNALKGSRPLLTFSPEFDADPALELIKEMFTQIFGTPAGHPKSKPFVDHVMTFTLLDGKIWFRHFQIVDSTQNPDEIKRALKRGDETVKLVEIGPRFVLNLIKIFENSFGGRTLCDNPDYSTPTAMRGEAKRRKGVSYAARKKAEGKRQERQEQNILPQDPILDLFRNGE